MVKTYFIVCTYRYNGGAIDARSELILDHYVIDTQEDYTVLRNKVYQHLLKHHSSVSNLEIHTLSILS